MKRIIALFLALLISGAVYAQAENCPLAGAAYGTANAAVTQVELLGAIPANLIYYLSSSTA